MQLNLFDELIPLKEEIKSFKEVFFLESFYKIRQSNRETNSCVAVFVNKKDAETMKSEIEETREDIDHCHITSHFIICKYENKKAYGIYET